jgi:hypothetical protein
MCERNKGIRDSRSSTLRVYDKGENRHVCVELRVAKVHVGTFVEDTDWCSPSTRRHGQKTQSATLTTPARVDITVAMSVKCVHKGVQRGHHASLRGHMCKPVCKHCADGRDELFIYDVAFESTSQLVVGKGRSQVGQQQHPLYCCPPPPLLTRVEHMSDQT